jgi:hypothetical protein
LRGPLFAHVGKNLGRQFVIDNKGGAGGTLGAGLAAKAAPDGYTFFMGAVHHAIAPSMYPKLDYNIETDFVPVGLVSSVPQVIVVNPAKVQATTLAQLLAHIRNNPGRLNYASAGNGTSHHLAGELFKLQTKTFITHIPYRGAGPALQDLIAGQVDMMFDGLGSSATHIKSGRLRAIAVAGEQACAGFPRRAHGGREWCAHLQGGHLVRHLGPQGHAARSHHGHAGRHAQGPEQPRTARHLDQPGHRHAQPVGGRLRPLRGQRNQALGRGGERLRRQTRLTMNAHRMAANLICRLARGLPGRPGRHGHRDRRHARTPLHYTWRDLERGTAMLANLIESLALPPDSRIAVQTEKSVEALMLYLAVLRAGHVYLPLNTAYQAGEIEYFIGNAEPAVVVCAGKNFGWVSKIAFPPARRMCSRWTTTAPARCSTAPPSERPAHAGRAQRRTIWPPSCTPAAPPGAARAPCSRTATCCQQRAGAEGLLGLAARRRAAARAAHLPRARPVRGFARCAAQRQQDDLVCRFDRARCARGCPKRPCSWACPRCTCGCWPNPASRAACRHMRLFISGSAPLLIETFNDFRSSAPATPFSSATA